MASVDLERFDGNTPLRADGTRWPFLLAVEDAAVVADHNAGLADALSAGSLEVPDDQTEQALLNRGALARHYAAMVQTIRLNDYLEGSAGCAVITEDELNIVLAPKSQEARLAWPGNHPVALIGVATSRCRTGLVGRRRTR